RAAAAAPRRAATRSRPRRRDGTARRTWRGYSFDERHLVDLAQRRPPHEHLLDRRVAQEPHPFFARGLLDLGGRPPIQDHVANPVREIQQLADRGASLVA